MFSKFRRKKTKRDKHKSGDGLTTYERVPSVPAMENEAVPQTYRVQQKGKTS